jgi:predicted acylesterase/phospholipase RssA
MSEPKVALMLSSGGAWEITHIGAIEELERQGYKISSIASCSMGAMVGAFYTTEPCQKAKNFYAANEDGRKQSWNGRVWQNLPYSNPLAERFLEKMAKHNNGIALVFYRIEVLL